jgi:hypothetical protein
MIWLLAFVALLLILGEIDTSQTAPISSGNSFIDALANAIAKAEGANPSINNPGDLTTGDVPGANVSGVFNSAGVAIIDTLENGWTFLFNKLQNIFNGTSDVYSPDMTISEFASTYTGGSNADSWAQSIADSFGTTVDTTLADLQSGFNGGGGQ